MRMLADPTFWKIVLAGFAATSLITQACQDPGDADRSAPWIVGEPQVDRIEAELTPDAAGAPEDSAPGCTPSCQSGQCGEDGCGGSCGPCSVLTPFCFAGWCQEDPVPKEPTLEVSPSFVDFGMVPLGELAERALTLRAMSKEAVEIREFTIEGSGDVVMMIADHPWRSPSGSPITVALDTPWRLEAGEMRTLDLRYTPLEEAPDEAVVTLWSNDLSAPMGHSIVLRGGPRVGCGAWSEESLDFGATIFGTKSAVPVTLTNCGTLTLDIASVSITGDSAGAFDLEGVAPSQLEPGASWTTSVGYAPTPGSVGALATLEAALSWDGGAAVAMMPLEGFVVVEDCPVAKVVVTESSPVWPGTVMHFSGQESYSPVSEVVEWSWSAEQPKGSVGTFAPTSTAPSPTFTVKNVGMYRFDLSVKDALGKSSCTPGVHQARVIPPSALYVELTWSTPGDEDESDEGLAVGSDLDLHLAHPLAAGKDLDGDGEPEPWFDPAWDCYWFNQDPDWGPFSPPTDDDPHLTIQDIDGAGPEAIAFDIPEVDTTYRVAVHAWQDHGFGPSVATVRVYLLEDKIFESQPLTLNAQDLWEVADITWHGWPEATVTPLAAEQGGPIVYPGASP